MNLIELIINLFTKSTSCEKEIRKIEYLNSRVESLTRSLSEAIPPIPINFEPKRIVRPYNIDGIKDCEVADLEYCSFTLDEWKVILSDIFDVLKPKEKYTSKVFDCDDFALLFSGILTYSAFKSGFATQPAFAISWSNTHAFNLFIDNENNVYVYEPQNNKIMTLNEAKQTELYNVRKIWFIS